MVSNSRNARTGKRAQTDESAPFTCRVLRSLVYYFSVIYGVPAVRNRSLSLVPGRMQGPGTLTLDDAVPEHRVAITVQQWTNGCSTDAPNALFDWYALRNSRLTVVQRNGDMCAVRYPQAHADSALSSYGADGLRSGALYTAFDISTRAQ